MRDVLPMALGFLLFRFAVAIPTWTLGGLILGEGWPEFGAYLVIHLASVALASWGLANLMDTDISDLLGEDEP